MNICEHKEVLSENEAALCDPSSTCGARNAMLNCKGCGCYISSVSTEGPNFVQTGSHGVKTTEHIFVADFPPSQKTYWMLKDEVKYPPAFRSSASAYIKVSSRP